MGFKTCASKDPDQTARICSLNLVFGVCFGLPRIQFLFGQTEETGQTEMVAQADLKLLWGRITMVHFLTLQFVSTVSALTWTLTMQCLSLLNILNSALGRFSR